MTLILAFTFFFGLCIVAAVAVIVLSKIETNSRKAQP